jgi:hypothetical protein
MLWTLYCNGTEKSLADWGLANPVRKLVSQGRDELTLSADSAAADSPPLFPFQSVATVRRNRTVNPDGTFSGGTVWFTGIVVQTPRHGAPEGEGLYYKIAGPWWYLDNYTFQQAYKNVFLGYSSGGGSGGAGTPQFGQKYSSHLFLNQGFPTGGTTNPWLKITTGAQIIEALNWALKPHLDAGTTAPFQIGTVSPDVDAPVDEVRDITCAEVIHKMLRWTPDAVTWFDYSTTPPTFHCQRRGELQAVNLALTGSGIKDLAINPRYDLQAPSVQIFYETASSVNGQASLSLTKDFYPDPLPTDPLKQFASLQFTVDLQGLQSSVSKASLVCEDIAPTVTSWWLARHPQYRSSDGVDGIAAFTLNSSSVVRSPNPAVSSAGVTVADKGFTRELISGQLTEWMTFGSQRITVKATADITYNNGTVQKRVPLSYQCLSTDAVTGPQLHQNIAAYPEPVPQGLAASIYSAISVLQYEGSLSLQEQEVDGTVRIGHVVNLTGSAIAAWDGMKVLIQEISEDLTSGVTTLYFGPPKFLSAGELVDLLRVNRLRTIRSSFSMRPGGSAGGNADSPVDIGEQQPEKNSIAGHIPPNPHVVSENPDGTGARILHSALSGDASITLGSSAAANTINLKLSDAGGANLYVRYLSVCQDGVAGGIYVLASNFIPG